jgi:glycosyltransferase involved in cell wall biosynthesis
VSIPHDIPQKEEALTRYLFMARLHYKKGIVPLVKAWKAVMSDRSDKMLVIAGPDEGELDRIRPLVGDNAKYIGPVYGEEKTEWLKKSHYYFLPSYSEGFPTSVLEAMSYGLIPLISEGCNFPQVLDMQLGYQAEPDERQLIMLLSKIRDVAFDKLQSMKNMQYIAEHYSEEVIGEALYKLYQSVLKEGHRGVV